MADLRPLSAARRMQGSAQINLTTDSAGMPIILIGIIAKGKPKVKPGSQIKGVNFDQIQNDLVLQ